MADGEARSHDAAVGIGSRATRGVLISGSPPTPLSFSGKSVPFSVDYIAIEGESK